MLNKFITRKNSENLLCFVVCQVFFLNLLVQLHVTHTHNRLTAVDPGLPG